jgi:hypothetical protein
MREPADTASVVARVGNLIYWVACVAALLWAVFVLMTTANLPHPDWSISTPLAIVGAVVIWIFGVAARYVLGRHHEHEP